MNLQRLAALFCAISLLAITSIQAANADEPDAPSSGIVVGGSVADPNNGTPESESNGFRPGWVMPANAARLVNRDVPLDANIPLPASGGGLWLFTSKAITRPQIASLAIAGVRYLGVITQNCYAMRYEGGDVVAARAAILGIGSIRGAALAESMDRVSEAVLPHVNAVMAAEPEQRATMTLPHPLGIHFWPRTTAGEVRALVPGADEWYRLPTNDAEAIGPECAAEVPGTGEMLARFALSPLVSSVDFAYPKVEDNQASRALANAPLVNNPPRNLDGTGVVVGEWDGGAIFMHNDFGGRVTVKESGSISSHATHVCGTILGSGAGNASARGFAPGATLVGYNFNGNVPNERRESKYLHRHEHDNHSWGSGGSGGFGGYATTARDFDTDCRDILLLGIKSAGNDGASSEIVVNAPEGNFGYDSVDGTSGSKNILVIGSSQDNGTDLSNFSARGPTDDGRIKPDVTANGQGLNSTYPNNAYSSINGTSMSAPSTTGVVTLMAQLHKQLNDDRRWAPDAARCTIMHSVRDVFHPGPDYRFGWGIVDADRAATLIEADAASGGRRIVRGALRDGEEREFKLMVGAGASELRLTATWLDAYNGGTAAKRLIHDLDLVVTDPLGNRAFPWTLDPANPHNDAVKTAVNTIDNIEQVLVDSPMEGEWTVTMRAVSISDPDQPVQGFVICSSHDVTGVATRVTAVPSDGPFVAIPDGSATGVTFDFPVNEAGVVGGVRVYLDINHARRGDLAVYLIGPSGTERQIETSDTSTRRDLHGIFPDLRSFDDDTVDFNGTPTNGTWRVRIVDSTASNLGEVRHLMLEVDVDPFPNRAPIANAGASQSVPSGAQVTLSGAASSDPDPGQNITYTWAQTAGTAVTLSATNTATIGFTAPIVTAPTLLQFTLTVRDPYDFTDTDDVQVTVTPALPNIDTISPNPAAPGELVTVTGTGLTGVSLRISGIVQTILSASDTQVTFRVGINVPVASSQALSLQTPFGADAASIDVSWGSLGGGGGLVPIPGEGGGGGGCALTRGMGGIGLGLFAILATMAGVVILRRRRV